jgi:diguanylate cyclase (GGDEF)-like protein/PAS domain S-box-containing protein
MWPFSHPLLKISLRYFLPIGGAISLVLLMALDQHRRHETLQTRMEGLQQAGVILVRSNFQEAEKHVSVLPEGQVWLSPVARPMLTNRGQRRGLIPAGVSVSRLKRDFDRITSSHPALLSGDGLTINASQSTPSGFNSAARYPSRVWQAMQLRPWGAVNTNQSLLLIGLIYGLAATSCLGLACYRGHLQALREQERHLQERQQAIQDSAPVGMCLCDPATGRFLSVNAALCAFFDRSAAELMQRNWQELTHPNDLEADQKLAEKLHRGEVNSYRLRMRFLGHDGSTKWGDLAVACTRNADSSIRELIGQLADVTELVDKTTYLQAASSAGVIGVWAWDVRSNQISWDAQMYRLYGLTQPQTTSTYKLWEQALHPDDRAMAVAALENTLKGGDPFDCQYRVVWPDRSVHDIRARGAIEFGQDGMNERIIGVNYDVTELMRKSAYLEAASMAGVIGVWDWDITNDVLTWDPVMYQLCGLRAEDFPGSLKSWDRAIHPDDKAFVRQEVQAALQGWRNYQPRFRVIWPDGSVHYIQARSRTTYRGDGSPERMIGVNYDITEQVERELEVEQQRAQLAATMDALLDPLMFLTLEASPLQAPALRIAEANPAACNFFGSNHGQLIGQPLSVLLPEDGNRELFCGLRNACRKRTSWIADEQSLKLSGIGEAIHADVRAVAGRDGVVLSFRDVSERRRTAGLLSQSEERFRLLAENASDAVFLTTEGIIRWMSPAITTMLGWQPEAWIDHQFVEFCHTDDIALALKHLDEINAGAVRVTRLRLRDHAGQWRWVEVHSGPYRNPRGEQIGIAGSMRTIDQEVAAESELDRRARSDELTGLMNRKEVLERLARFSDNRRQGDGEVAVLFCDVDHFKSINDHHGHGGGDAVLSALARRLLTTTRHGDLVGRIGGDELLVVLNRIPSLAAAEAVAKKIHAAACTPVHLATGEVMPTLSIGVTLIHKGESVDAVVERADQAMYKAKQHGRDRVISFS